MKLLRYAAPVMLGLVAVILLLLFAFCVWVGVLVMVDPSYGDPTTVIFIPFGLLFFAAPGVALALAAFKTWPGRAERPGASGDPAPVESTKRRPASRA